MMNLSALRIGLRLILLTLVPSSAYALSYSGAVSDCSGRPASGTVILQEIYGVNGLARARKACTQELDNAGRFTCGSMVAGRYAVALLAKAANPATPDLLATPLMPRETQDDGPIRLNEESAGTKHALHVCTTATTPVLAAIPDRPVASYLNLAFATSEGDLPTGVSPVYDAETGKVSMPQLGPGIYHLQAYWFANGEDRRFDRILRVPEDTQSELALEQTVYRVSGTVHIERGASILSGLHIIASCGQFGSIVHRKVPVAEDGAFTFDHLDAPACSFSLEGLGSVNIASMEVNDTPAQYGQALLKPFPCVNRVDLNATAARSSLSGHVEGKEEVAGSAVVACSVGSGACETTKASTDGTFRFSGLPAGPYRVSSWTALDRVEYRVPAFMRQYASSSGEVQLSAGQPADISVTVIRAF